MQKGDVIFQKLSLVFLFSVYQDKTHYLLWPWLLSGKQLSVSFKLGKVIEAITNGKYLKNVFSYFGLGMTVGVG